MGEWSDDIIWLAVDRDGCIAAFVANECGAVPDCLKLDRLETELHETYSALRQATGEKVDGDPDLDLDTDDLIPSGVYVYWHDGGWLAWPYERLTVPDSPIRSASLPAAIVAHMVAFDGRFGDRVELQPVEHWTSRAPVAAWLESGTNTVRCLAGHEATFDAEAQAVEREFPGEYRIAPRTS
jgi:hypothetical protein